MNHAQWHLYADGTEVEPPVGWELVMEPGVPVSDTVMFYGVPAEAALRLEFQGFADEAPVFETALDPLPAT